jgi:hypothetical protein
MAEATVVGYTGFLATGDIAFAPDGALYMAAGDLWETSDLVRVDPTTGEGTLVGSIGYTDVFGPDFLGDTLYGATRDGELITIDTDTGTGQLVRNTIDGIFGVASMPAPIPEPGSAALLLSAALCAARMVWRRKPRRLVIVYRSRTGKPVMQPV